MFGWIPDGVSYPTADWFPSANNSIMPKNESIIISNNTDAVNMTSECLDLIKRDGNHSFIYITCRGVVRERKIVKIKLNKVYFNF